MGQQLTYAFASKVPRLDSFVFCVSNQIGFPNVNACMGIPYFPFSKTLQAVIEDGNSPEVDQDDQERASSVSLQHKSPTELQPSHLTSANPSQDSISGNVHHEGVTPHIDERTSESQHGSRYSANHSSGSSSDPSVNLLAATGPYRVDYSDLLSKLKSRDFVSCVEMLGKDSRFSRLFNECRDAHISQPLEVLHFIIRSKYFDSIKLNDKSLQSIFAVLYSNVISVLQGMQSPETSSTDELRHYNATSDQREGLAALYEGCKAEVIKFVQIHVLLDIHNKFTQIVNELRGEQSAKTRDRTDEIDDDNSNSDDDDDHNRVDSDGRQSKMAVGDKKSSKRNFDSSNSSSHIHSHHSCISQLFESVSKVLVDFSYLDDCFGLKPTLPLLSALQHEVDFESLIVLKSFRQSSKLSYFCSKIIPTYNDQNMNHSSPFDASWDSIIQLAIHTLKLQQMNQLMARINQDQNSKSSVSIGAEYESLQENYEESMIMKSTSKSLSSTLSSMSSSISMSSSSINSTSPFKHLSWLNFQSSPLFDPKSMTACLDDTSIMISLIESYKTFIRRYYEKGIEEMKSKGHSFYDAGSSFTETAATMPVSSSTPSTGPLSSSSSSSSSTNPSTGPLSSSSNPLSLPYIAHLFDESIDNLSNHNIRSFVSEPLNLLLEESKLANDFILLESWHFAQSISLVTSKISNIDLMNTTSGSQSSVEDDIDPESSRTNSRFTSTQSSFKSTNSSLHGHSSNRNTAAALQLSDTSTYSIIEELLTLLVRSVERSLSTKHFHASFSLLSRISAFLCNLLPTLLSNRFNTCLLKSMNMEWNQDRLMKTNCNKIRNQIQNTSNKRSDSQATLLSSSFLSSSPSILLSSSPSPLSHLQDSKKNFEAQKSVLPSQTLNAMSTTLKKYSKNVMGGLFDIISSVAYEGDENEEQTKNENQTLEMQISDTNTTNNSQNNTDNDFNNDKLVESDQGIVEQATKVEHSSTLNKSFLASHGSNLASDIKSFHEADIFEYMQMWRREQSKLEADLSNDKSSFSLFNIQSSSSPSSSSIPSKSSSHTVHLLPNVFNSLSESDSSQNYVSISAAFNDVFQAQSLFPKIHQDLVAKIHYYFKDDASRKALKSVISPLTKQAWKSTLKSVKNNENKEKKDQSTTNHRNNHGDVHNVHDGHSDGHVGHGGSRSGHDEMKSFHHSEASHNHQSTSIHHHSSSSSPYDYLPCTIPSLLLEKSFLFCLNLFGVFQPGIFHYLTLFYHTSYELDDSSYKDIIARSEERWSYVCSAWLSNQIKIVSKNLVVDASGALIACIVTQFNRYLENIIQNKKFSQFGAFLLDSDMKKFHSMFSSLLEEDQSNMSSKTRSLASTQSLRDKFLVLNEIVSVLCFEKENEVFEFWKESQRFEDEANRMQKEIRYGNDDDDNQQQGYQQQGDHQRGHDKQHERHHSSSSSSPPSIPSSIDEMIKRHFGERLKSEQSGWYLSPKQIKIFMQTRIEWNKSIINQLNFECEKN